jgi:hypothetical protein
MPLSAEAGRGRINIQRFKRYQLPALRHLAMPGTPQLARLICPRKSE